MTQLLPPTDSTQPASTAMQLALKDELRSLRFNLQQGAHWLQGVGEALADRSGLHPPPVAISSLGKLQHLIGDAAQQAASGLRMAREVTGQVARQTLAATRATGAPLPSVSPLDALGGFAFNSGGPEEFLPLAACFTTPGQPASLHFTQQFYRLIRELMRARDAAESTPTRPLIARQQAIDEAYWHVAERHAGLIARLTGEPAGSAHVHPGDQALLCAATLRALIDVRPLRDPSLPPWAGQALPDAEAREVTRSLLAAVLAAGLAQDRTGVARDMADCLRLGTRFAQARLPDVELALDQARPDEALAAEFAFIFRHA